MSPEVRPFITEELISSPMDAIISVDAEQRIRIFNAAAEKMFGCTAAEAIGQPLDHFISARFRHAHRQHVEQSGQTSVTRRSMGSLGAIYGLRTNGEEFPLEASISQTEVDGQKFYTVILRDNTERRMVEAGLRNSEERFRTLSAFSPVGIFQTDAEGKCLYTNSRWQELAGLSLEESLGVGWSQAIHPDDRAAVFSKWEQAASEGREFAREFRFLRPDGEVRWVSARARAVRSEDGQVIGYVGTDEDITERKQAEEERRYLEEQLFEAQKMESIGTLAGGIAHDFNIIMTAIIGNVHLLKLRLPAETRLAEHLKDIETAATRAASLTQQLLSFSCRQRLARAQLDLLLLLTALTGRLRMIFGQHISIELRAQPELPLIFADASQIEQIIMNLAVNARDAMPDGGHLTITISEVTIEQDFGHHDLQVRAGHYVRLTISDTGSGMDAETQQRAFEPFFTTKIVGQGTGLGLSVVYGLMRQHDGYVHLASAPGSGTTFDLYFPVLVQQARISTVADAPVRPGTILVAEDDESVRKLAQEILAELGHTVLLARNGAEAVELYSAHQSEIDLLLLDVIMPGMGGFEAYEQIMARCGAVPVIFMSGYNSEVIRTRPPVGSEAVIIPKPWNIELLSRQVREMLDQRAPRGISL
jgi:two-component system NtrC family sensor kinase